MTERRFPPPWTVDELEACFVVRDEAGQKLAYVYFEEDPGRRSAAKLLTKDEARRIASNIANLPNLLRAVWAENGMYDEWQYAKARPRGDRSSAVSFGTFAALGEGQNPNTPAVEHEAEEYWGR